ncbi:hypothetical protein HD553DRAFT_3646 [Filobasidium floriforme]|uniref:uncharacterized protein n=1 Tax=Filobasidium floriforme TaxID=5210 RepID=UPI001E8EA0AB|nr:uncharacterized protein HD553DRAFT_3646 [Filobasidium floriforme]KAH8090393.1 hypothetical protein HD553DRAFT_3646 [Filobasidium floriforme]
MPSLNYAALNGLMGESYDARQDPYHEQNYNPGLLDRYRQGSLHYNHLQDNVMAEEHDLNTMLPHSDSSAMPDDSPTLRHLQYRNQNQQYRHQADGRYDVVPHSNQAAAYEEREAYPYEPEPIQDYPSDEYEQVNRNGMDLEGDDVQDPRTMPMQSRYGFDGGHNGPSTSHDYTLPPNNNGMSQMTAHGIDLVPTTRLPDSFRRIFRFRQFNAVQSKVFPSVYGTDDNLVVSSPTGSGKTAIFELALLRMIKSWSTQDEMDRKVAVYLAPTKALCTERYQDWKEKFQPLGLKCLEYTGDTDGTKSFAVESRNVDIIITTPEKWDAVTRVTRHSDQIMQRLGLLMIDEVHLLHESRGAVLEVVVSRMRTTARASPVRVVALSATVPNVEDVARWLRPLTPSGTDIYEAGGSGGAADQRAAYLDMKMAKVYKFGEAFRPTRLERFVVGYNSAGNDFAFAARLKAELYDCLLKHAKNKPVLVFAATRKSCEQIAEELLKRYQADRQNGRRVPWKISGSPIEVANSKDATLAGAGIAFHHGGLEQLARKRIEDGFRSGQLMIIVSTSTLAVGVNLPAHTVVVVGTKCWINGGMEEYSDLDMQQMIGRAGRPQYDTHGQVVIMCEKQHEQKWKDSVESKTILESRLHETLTEHINSEISLRTIRSLSDGHQWIQSSFLYVRIQQNPKHYAAALATKGEHSMNWQQALDDFVNSAVEQLSKDGLVETDDGADVVEDYNLRSVASTKLGDVMSACVLRLPTMQKILAMPKNATFEELLSLFCSSAEFSEIAFRQAEKTLLRKINKGDEFRFPAPTNQAFEHHHWVSMLMQTCLGAICLEDYLDQSKGQKINLTKELYQIWRCAPRICRAIAFVAGTKEYGGAMLSALELMRTINGKAWEDSTVVLRQIDAIGPKSIKVLASQNIKGFADLRRQSASRLELLLNRHPGFGNKLLEAAQDFPTFRLQIQQETDTSEETVGPIKIEFSVVIEVEGRLIKKGAKKGGKSGHRNLSIVAIRSDGEYVTEFHTSTKNFETVNRSLRIPAAFTEEGQKLLVMVGIDQLAGCSSVQEFSPEIPEGVLPKPAVNEADSLQTSLPNVSAAKPTKKAVDPVAMQNMNGESPLLGSSALRPAAYLGVSRGTSLRHVLRGFAG